MNELTDDIRASVRQGWRVGVLTSEGIRVSDVRARIGDRLRVDEVWLIFRKPDGKLSGWALQDARQFIDVNMKDVCYCYEIARGSQYLVPELMALYGH